MPGFVVDADRRRIDVYRLADRPDATHSADRERNSTVLETDVTSLAAQIDW
jgi:hypothetical protein